MNALLTAQAEAVYTLLKAEGPLTAKEIGNGLHVLPNTVYRAAEQLIKLGVARKTEDYPVRFELVAPETALQWYLLLARRQFLANFPAAREAKTRKMAGPNITFIRDRQMLLRYTDRDTKAAKKSINFIVSGLEVPDETVFAYRKARAHGVLIRALTQKRGETSKERLERWQGIGVEMRETLDLGLRLFVFDAKVVYFTSYDQRQKEQAFGVRFEYPPVAAVMDQLFEEWWQQAEV